MKEYITRTSRGERVKHPVASEPTPRNVSEARLYSRKPKTGVVKTGRNAGLPPRNQTDRQEFMVWEDAAALVDAEQYAASIGQPLTTWITVSWKHAPVFDGDDKQSWDDNHDMLWRAIRNYLSRMRIPFTYVFIRERAQRVGGHTHIMMHVPGVGRATTLAGLERQICQRCRFVSPFAVKIEGMRSPGSVTARQRNGLLKYVIASLNPQEVALIGASSQGKLVDFLGIRPKPQVPLPQNLRRIGVAESIGPAPRKKACYVDIANIPELADALLRYGNTSGTTLVPRFKPKPASRSAKSKP